MQKICCFGELLLRMSPALNGQWIHEAAMPVYIGGSELNVANALAAWQQSVKYVTALPKNSLSNEIFEELTKKKIDTSSICFTGDRIGIYFLPQGTELKHVSVIYDRAHSSFASLKRGMLDWENILNDVSWLHFSAISPAVNGDTANVCEEALIAASKKNIPISMDLNYRAKLWQYGKNPVEVMPALVEHCDVIMGNIWSANNLLGIHTDENIHNKKHKEAYLQHATETANSIMRQFKKCNIVANTFRFNLNDGVHYFAALNRKNEQYVSKEFYIKNVIDKVGTGDCFMAGLIYGLCNHFSFQKTVDFAAAAATGKMLEIGDATKQTAEDVIKKLGK